MNELVIIGQDIDINSMTKKLDDCLITLKEEQDYNQNKVFEDPFVDFE